MYRYSEEALSAIKQRIMGNMNIFVQSEAGIALFCYDNDHYIIESFLPHNSHISVTVKGAKCSVTNVENGRVIDGTFENNNSVFSFDISPSNFGVFRVNKYK